MAKQTVGELIREARTKAGLSQAALAGQIEGLSASDLGKAERGEKELSQAQLKAIAKATGVTQKSLLEAAAGTASTSSTAKKTSTSSTAKKTSTSSTAKKTSTTSSAKKTSSTSTASKPAAQKTESAAVELTSAEKTMLNAWRKADAETRKAALRLLRGEKDEPNAPDTDDLLGTLLSGAMDMLGNLGKK